MNQIIERMIYNMHMIEKLYKDLNNDLQILRKSIKRKGTNCSISGNNYEKQIYNTIKYYKLNGQLFNTQNENELGGSTSSNDLLCNFNGIKNIGIEIKKHTTPDWMQCSLILDNGKWKGSEKCKIPKNSKAIFEKIINDHKIFENKKPPFIANKLTYEQWKQIKQNDNTWNDKYFIIPNDTIKKIYQEKGCHYIQISNYGLYHLGNDICNFNVPEFIIEQELRIRIKVHKTKDSQGYCKLSVMSACQPINIKQLIKSNYSLDNKDKLPRNLIY